MGHLDSPASFITKEEYDAINDFHQYWEQNIRVGDEF